MNRLISIRQACEITSLSRSTLWKKIRTHQFPQPVRLGCDRKAFLASEIEEWIEQLKTTRDQDDG